MIKEVGFLIKSAKVYADRVRVLSYIATNFLLRHSAKSQLWQKELEIDFNDISLVFKTFSSELSSYFEIYLQRVYERDVSFAARPQDVVFDVGANIGVYSIRQAQREASVYAFEPNPDAFSRLKRNIALNAPNNVTAINKAVHSNSSRVAFKLNARSTLAGKVVASNNRSETSEYGY